MAIIYLITNKLNNKKLLSHKRKNCKSKYRGVSPIKNGKWLACIKIQGKTQNIGTFCTEESAFKSYKKKLWEVSYCSSARS